MPTRTRIRSSVAAAACVLLASACGGDSIDAPSVGDAPGNYELQTVNGQLPFQFSHTDASGVTTVDILSGTLVLTTTGTFEEVLNYHVVPPSPQTAYDAPAITAGTFSVNGGNITFTYHPPNAPVYSWGGTVSTGSLTYIDPNFQDVPGGLTAVYTK